MTTSSLKITYTVLLSEDKHTGPCLGFYKWLPEGKDYTLERKLDNATITLSFDKACVAQIDEVTDETIRHYSVNRIFKIYAEVDFGHISSELTTFIYDERESGSGKHFGIQPNDQRYSNLNNEYNSLGEQALKAVLLTCNRFISYARNIKGQYWLNTLNPNKDNLANLNNVWSAIAIIDEKKIRWFPPATNRISFVFSLDHEQAVKKEEWHELSSFVKSDSRPNVVFELLSNARYLFKQGHRRSSIIESVTALEVAVSDFTKSPNIERLEISESKFRIDTGNIGNQSKHLGFTGSLRYLIPLLLSKDELDNQILEKCYQAIEVRNNVVHKGQRDVKEDFAREIINAISECCKILNSYINK